jgi:hypothetical protein
MQNVLLVDQASTVLGHNGQEWRISHVGLGFANVSLGVEQVDWDAECIGSIWEDTAVVCIGDNHSNRALDQVNKDCANQDKGVVGTTGSLNVETNNDTTCDAW